MKLNNFKRLFGNIQKGKVQQTSQLIIDQQQKKLEENQKEKKNIQSKFHGTFNVALLNIDQKESKDHRFLSLQPNIKIQEILKKQSSKLNINMSIEQFLIANSKDETNLQNNSIQNVQPQDNQNILKSSKYKSLIITDYMVFQNLEQQQFNPFNFTPKTSLLSQIEDQEPLKKNEQEVKIEINQKRELRKEFIKKVKDIYEHNPQLRQIIKEFQASDKHVIALGPSAVLLTDLIYYSINQTNSAKKVQPGKDGNYGWIFLNNYNFQINHFYDKDNKYLRINYLGNQSEEQNKLLENEIHKILTLLKQRVHFGG